MQTPPMERKFVNESQISKYLKCTSCLQVFVDPQRLKCGHTFCSECIIKWLKLQQSCPTCRQKAVIKDLKPDLIAIGLISELSVYCYNKKYGCKWAGTQETVESHQKKCNAKEVQQTLKLNVQQDDDDEENEAIQHKNDPGSLLARIDGDIQQKKELMKIIDCQFDQDDPLDILQELVKMESINKREIDISELDMPNLTRDKVTN